MSGELTQSQRSESLQALRDGHAASRRTDRGPRGLDLPDLGLAPCEIPVNKAGLLTVRAARSGRQEGRTVLRSAIRAAEGRLMLQSASIVAEGSGSAVGRDDRRERPQEDAGRHGLTRRSRTRQAGAGPAVARKTTPEKVAAARIA